MKIASGKVVNGRVVFEGEAMSEGTVVTVLAREDVGPFRVTPEMSAALLPGVPDSERRELVSWYELWLQLQGLR